MTAPDVSSLSATASTLRRLGAALTGPGHALAGAVSAAADGWTGAAARVARRRGAALAGGAGELARELDAVGRALADHAAEVSSLATASRAVEDASRRAGLEVRDGLVGRPFGITGEADSAWVARQDVLIAEQQHALEEVDASLAAAAESLRGALTASRQRLAAVSESLRRL